MTGSLDWGFVFVLVGVFLGGWGRGLYPKDKENAICLSYGVSD